MKTLPPTGCCFFCADPAVGHMACKYCAKLVPFCEAHTSEAHALTAGHAFQEHPETLPDEEWAELIGNSEALAAVEAAIDKAAETDPDGPEAWAKVKAHIAARKKS